jgi:hypothetical protein
MKSSEYQQKKELDWQMTQIRVSVYLNLICFFKVQRQYAKVG